MPASIIVNQVTKPAGVAGKSREDFDTGLSVTFSNNTAEISYLWTLTDVPIRSALVRGTVGTLSTFSFIPDVKGTYRVTLRVNGSAAASDNQARYCAILTSGAKTLAWRYPAAGEQNTEDNVDKLGLGFPGNANPRGWATDLDLQLEEAEEATYDVLNAVVISPGPGPTNDNLVRLDTATGTLDFSVLPPLPSGGGKQIPGNLRTSEIQDTSIGVEVKLGAFAMSPISLDPSLTGSFRHTFVGTLYDAGGIAPALDLRLYDMGAPGVPQPGDLRATVTISTTGLLLRDFTALTPSAAPTAPGTSPNDGTVYDSERIYELRGYLSGDAGDRAEVDWAGVVIV